MSDQTGSNRLSERSTDSAALGNFSLHEAASDSNLRFGSGTIILTGTAALNGTNASADTHIITITDVTPTTDFETNNQPNGQSSVTFTIYVVTPAHSLGSPSTGLASNTNSVYYAYKDAEHQVDGAFDFDPDENAPVYYSVQGVEASTWALVSRNSVFPMGY